MRLIPWRGLGRWVAILTLVGPLGAAGCTGGGTGTVSGKVYYKGKELKGGTVTFVPADQASKFCRIGEDGSYSIPDVPVGEAKIKVETESLKAVAGYSYKPPKDAPEGYKPPDLKEQGKRYIPIPGKYADKEESGLKYKVTTGKQDYDIKLE